MIRARVVNSFAKRAAAGALLWAALSVTSCSDLRTATQPANISSTAPAPTGSNEPAPSTDAVELSSPTAAYHTALTARKRCDMPVLKRVMSEAMLSSLETLGKDNPGGAKSLDDMIHQLCQMPEVPNSDQIKDEKIVGDEGTLKFMDETGAWRLMDFVRENGEWKLTLPRGRNELPALK